jgi:hypothetical protein
MGNERTGAASVVNQEELGERLLFVRLYRQIVVSRGKTPYK